MAEKCYLTAEQAEEVFTEGYAHLYYNDGDGRLYMWKQTLPGESVALASANCVMMQQAIQLQQEAEHLYCRLSCRPMIRNANVVCDCRLMAQCLKLSLPDYLVRFKKPKMSW
jgi:hypothetical protein